MISPVWLDGPLAGRDYEIDDAAVEDAFRYTDGLGGPAFVYTFTQVVVFGVSLIVASVKVGMLTPEEVCRGVMTPQALRAAGL